MFHVKHLANISLTPQSATYSDESASAVAEVGAPAVVEEEMEITPAMLIAGVEELSSFNLDFESPEEVVTRIYRHMQLAANARLRERQLLYRG
jgi:hypothetical protein